jgi:hypothetical protein
MTSFSGEKFRERKHEGQEALGFQPRLLPFSETLLDFGQVHDCGFRMLRSHVCMTGLSMGNGFLQFLDAFVQMRIFYARSLRMLQCLFRMLCDGIGVTLLAVTDRSLRMLNSFGYVFVVSLGH